MLGCGVVGTGVVKLIEKHRAQFLSNGFDLRLTEIAVRDLDKERGVSLDGIALTTDAVKLAGAADYDLLVEVMGGNTVAVDACCKALERGKPVVTANKSALARSLGRLLDAARTGGASLSCEAAVAAHIPIIEVLDRSLACEELRVIKGVLNGSTNYILTFMERAGCEYDVALADASAKGFTEADPALDLEGIDAAEKLCLLAYKAFGVCVPLEKVHTEGITGINQADVQLAAELNHRIKLIAAARMTDDGLSLRVHPALIHRGELLADVDSEFNAIILEGPGFGELTFLGKGAGQIPTASAILNDMVKLARRLPSGGALPGFEKAVSPAPALVSTGGLAFCYFLRLKVLSPGVIDGIVSFFETQNIRVLGRALITMAGDEYLGLITDVCKETHMMHLLSSLGQVDGVLDKPAFIRLDKDNYRELVEREQRAYFGTSLERESRAGI